MESSATKSPREGCSTIDVVIHIQQSWINRFTDQRDLSIQVNEKIKLENFRTHISADKLMLIASISDKPGSEIEVTCDPRWDVSLQKLFLENVTWQTRTKNLLLKSAGWFAGTFLQNKIDKKIEDFTESFYREQLDQLIHKSIRVAIPQQGDVVLNVKTVTIDSMAFGEKTIDVMMRLDGHCAIHLMGENG